MHGYKSAGDAAGAVMYAMDIIPMIPEVQSLETFLGYLEANGAQAICAATFNTMLTEWPECVATESNPRTTQTYVSSRPSLPEQV